MTSISVPAANNVTTVTIRSNLSANFSWVEANAIADNSFSHVRATGHAWLSGPSGSQNSAITLVNFFAADGDVWSHNDMPSQTVNAVFELNALVPAGNESTIEVFETVFLHTDSVGLGHSFIEGNFNWTPLSVTMTSGCRGFLQIP